MLPKTLAETFYFAFLTTKIIYSIRIERKSVIIKNDKVVELHKKWRRGCVIAVKISHL